MWMCLEGIDMWDIIDGESIVRTKNWHTMSVIFIAIIEDIMAQLNVKKMTKEIWTILKMMNVRADFVHKARV